MCYKIKVLENQFAYSISKEYMGYNEKSGFDNFFFNIFEEYYILGKKKISNLIIIWLKKIHIKIFKKFRD